MRYIKAEVIKLLKSPFIWVMSSVYIVLFLILGYQYTLNTSANVIEPELKNPVNLYSFFIIMFAAFFNVIFAVILGGQVAGKDFQTGTIQLFVQNAGRYKGFLAKIALIAIVCVCFIAIVVILGVILGLSVSNLSASEITKITDEIFTMDLLKRFAIGFLSTFLISLFSMTVAILLKNTSKSNLICCLLFLVQNFLPFNICKYLFYLNPYYYLSIFSDSVFGNLKNLQNISFGTNNTMTEYVNIGLLVVYASVCLVVQVVVYRKREYI